MGKNRVEARSALRIGCRMVGYASCLQTHLLPAALRAAQSDDKVTQEGIGPQN